MWAEAAMAKQLNWEKRRFDRSPKMSAKDETEFRKNDLAARWLADTEERAAARKAREAKKAKRRSAASTSKPPWDWAPWDEGKVKAMKQLESMILWDERSKELQIVPWPDRERQWKHLPSSAGACYSALHDMKAPDRVKALLTDFVMLTVHYGFDPKVVHETFMEIDEYLDVIGSPYQAETYGEPS
jgi:hypothetical protein